MRRSSGSRFYDSRRVRRSGREPDETTEVTVAKPSALLFLPLHFSGSFQFYEEKVSLLSRGRLHGLTFQRGHGETEDDFIAVGRRLLRRIKIVRFHLGHFRFPVIGGAGESASVG